MNGKALHFICGAIIAAAATLIGADQALAVMAALAAGISKELWDAARARSIWRIDALDIIATLAGGVVVAAAWEVLA